MIRRLVVGDVHGCYAELMDLLDLAGLGPGDELVSVGDLVDRGPDTARVLDFFRGNPWASAVLGNHERAHRRAIKRRAEPVDFCQRAAREQFGPRFEDYAAALAWTATLPAYRELPEVLVVHGLWEPGLPIERQSDRVLAGTAWGEAHVAARHPGPWYEHYEGPKPLIVGHRDYGGEGRPLVFRDRVFGIDTGCCYGRRLTGLLLPEFRLLSVPARADHWAETCRRHAHLRDGGPDAVS